MKKILSAILLSSLFVVISAVSAFAADGTIAVSFKDANGNAVESLKVGETATMEMTLTLAGSPKIGTAEIFYELENLTLESTDANYTGASFQLMNFSAADIRSQKWTATVTATEVGTAKFIVTLDSYAADTDANEYYDFEVTGNAFTVKGNEPTELPTASISYPTAEQEEATKVDGYVTKSALVTVPFTADKKKPSSVDVTVKAPNSTTEVKEKTYNFPFATDVKNGNLKVAINVLGVPETHTVTFAAQVK